MEKVNIAITWYALKCNEALDDTEEGRKHLKLTHRTNIFELDKETRITVDQNVTKMPLELVAGLDFESQSESKRGITVKGWRQQLGGGGIFS